MAIEWKRRKINGSALNVVGLDPFIFIPTRKIIKTGLIVVISILIMTDIPDKIAILMNKCIGNGLAINLAIKLAINLKNRNE